MENERKKRDREDELRRERRRVREDERLEGRQPMGGKMKGCFGREFAMGIPEWDIEAENEGLTPLKNRWSSLYDVSQDEAMKMVKGRGTSYQDEIKAQRMTRRMEMDDKSEY